MFINLMLIVFRSIQVLLWPYLKVFIVVNSSLILFCTYELEITNESEQICLVSASNLLTFFLVNCYSVLVLLETLANCKSSDILFLVSFWSRKDNLLSYTLWNTTIYWNKVSHIMHVFIYCILALQSKGVPMYSQTYLYSEKSKFFTCFALHPRLCF